MISTTLLLLFPKSYILYLQATSYDLRFRAWSSRFHIQMQNAFCNRNHRRRCRLAARGQRIARWEPRLQAIGNRFWTPAKEMTRTATIKELNSRKGNLDPLQKLKITISPPFCCKVIPDEVKSPVANALAAIPNIVQWAVEQLFGASSINGQRGIRSVIYDA